GGQVLRGDAGLVRSLDDRLPVPGRGPGVGRRRGGTACRGATLRAGRRGARGVGRRSPTSRRPGLATWRRNPGRRPRGPADGARPAVRPARKRGVGPGTGIAGVRAPAARRATLVVWAFRPADRP